VSVSRHRCGVGGEGAARALLGWFRGRVGDAGQGRRDGCASGGGSVRWRYFRLTGSHRSGPVLGPEMRATGEVMRIADNFGTAFYKTQDATVTPLPTDPKEGGVLVTVPEDARVVVSDAVRRLCDLGFAIYATRGTSGVSCELVLKLHEGRPNIVDAIENGKIGLVFDIPIGERKSGRQLHTEGCDKTQGSVHHLHQRRRWLRLRGSRLRSEAR
jgi:hypothetical protein